ncbi:MAG: hypothetical protein KGR48_03210 [Alphaproteobacteria bacterium]|nr:hypothetical protein [Alphaproteobacteria bacterium]MBU6471248.1 hypothetical protein [Alphaproteobacteria bacterium]MDE2014073.1 hypothetical protein [Alphaproteobacteria bacterium]MDE2073091.1 hypothetical protein [Alphaproteobacteria bacterium]MDE2352108.1 hypothetical protein [Alphaproteobacteria bacterium]
MKTAIAAAAFAVLAPAALELAALAGPAIAAGQASRPVCLRTIQIDHTEVPNSRTILFYMRDGKVWQNTLLNDCVGLKFEGFAYAPTPPDEICDNMQTIHVLRMGTVCMMGAFTPYTPPKAKPAR